LQLKQYIKFSLLSSQIEIFEIRKLLAIRQRIELKLGKNLLPNKILLKNFHSVNEVPKKKYFQMYQIWQNKTLQIKKTKREVIQLGDFMG